MPTHNTRSIFAALLIGSVLTLVSCDGNKTTSSTPSGDTIEKNTSPEINTGTTIRPATDTAKYTVSGTIQDITQGKDGYMADLKGEDGKLYSMTVSVMRLTNRYTKFNKGDKVTVSSDTILLGDKVNVLVTEWSKP